ncbi:MAG TPA: LytTR family DNA-binding domain-containing protein [Methylibium sp.]
MTSTSVTALVADDEEAAREQLVEALQRCWPELQVVAEADNGVDAWDAVLEHEPQICFLDVRMPGLTGIEVARRIDGCAHVVFVAAPGDRAVAAFESAAVDHVIKPVDDAHLGHALEKLKRRLRHSPPADMHALLTQLLGQVRRPELPEVIQASLGREHRLIRVDDVVYFESDARYTRVVLSDGDELIRMSLKELLPQLDTEQFWQIHRSVIVNHRHIAGAQHQDDGNMVLMLVGRDEKLPVSRHFQGLFKAA